MPEIGRDWVGYTWLGWEELLAYYEAHDGYRMRIRLTRSEMDGLSRQDLEREHPALMAFKGLPACFARAAGNFVDEAFFKAIG